MGFQALDRKIDRAPSSYEHVANDVVTLKKDRINKDKTKSPVDLIKISRAKMKELGIDTPAFGLRALIDNEVQGVFLAVVPKALAKAYQGRVTTKKKSQEAGYNEIFEKLEEFGQIATDRPYDYKAAYNLVAVSPEELAGAQEAVSPEIKGVYKLVPTDLIQSATKEEGEDEPEEEEVEGEEESVEAEDTATGEYE